MPERGGSRTDVPHHRSSRNRVRVRGVRASPLADRRVLGRAGAPAVHGDAVPGRWAPLLGLREEGLAPTCSAARRAAGRLANSAQASDQTPSTPRVGFASGVLSACLVVSGWVQAGLPPSATRPMGPRFSGRLTVMRGSVRPQSLILYSSAL